MREVTARMRIVFVGLVLCGAFVASCAPASASSSSAVQPYIILAQDSGVIHFVDPTTLANIGALRVSNERSYLWNISATPNGQVLFVEAYPGGQAHQFALDLSTRAMCLLTQQGRVLMASPDGRSLIVQRMESMVNDGSGFRFLDHSGLEIWDAQMFEPQESIALLGNYPDQFFPSPDARWLYGLLYTSGPPYGNAERVLHVFDTNARRFIAQLQWGKSSPRGTYPRAAWDTVAPRFYFTDGERLVVIDASSQTILREMPLVLRGPRGPEPTVDGTWLEIAGARDGRVYLYHPFGGYWIYDYEAEARGEISGGLFVVDTNTGEQIAHWQPSIAFSHVIAGGDRLYGIQAKRDLDVESDPDIDLFMLDAVDGILLASRTLEYDRWTLAYVQLDPNVVPVEREPMVAQSCSRLEPTLIPFTPPVPAPTQAPQK